MQPVSVREATNSDVETLLRILQAAFEEYRGRLDPPSGAHGETIQRLLEALETTSALLALIDGEAVGCVFYKVNDEALYFFRLAVLPEHRRCGVGRALIERMEAEARRHGCSRVLLGVRLALAENRAYYERLGYRAVSLGSHKGYQEPTYVTLEKRLDDATEPVPREI